MKLARMGSLDKRLEEFEGTITPQHPLAMHQQVCAGREALATSSSIIVTWHSETSSCLGRSTTLSM
eukprot:m.407042 g.407042  ORF g.407042 m.407042 type:complete len:66 (-) comp28439_c0_seq11:589-786(-)